MNKRVQLHTFLFYVIALLGVGGANLNKFTMDAKVKEFLEKKQAEESAVLLEKKHDLLRRLGLVERVEVGKDDDYVSYSWDNEKNVYIYYKYVYPEITDEEYKELQKYDLELEVKLEGNGEEGLRTVSVIVLAISIIGALICFVVGISFTNKLFGGAAFAGLWFFMSVAVLLFGLIQYWIVKVFTNISCKSTAIYELLKDKEK